MVLSDRWRRHVLVRRIERASWGCHSSASMPGTWDSSDGTGREVGDLARKIAEGDFTVEQRMTLDVTKERPDGSSADDWALNEAVIMHTMSHCLRSFCAGGRRPGSVHLRRRRHDSVDANRVDGTLFGWRACCVAGREAIVVAPLAAHGLFTRPRRRTIRLRWRSSVLDDMWTSPEMWCDGLRRMTVPAARLFAHVGSLRCVWSGWTTRHFLPALVRKFNLPVRGWRDGPR